MHVGVVLELAPTGILGSFFGEQSVEVHERPHSLQLCFYLLSSFLQLHEVLHSLKLLLFWICIALIHCLQLIEVLHLP